MLSRLRLLTSGSSHGPGLTGILDGVPAGVPLSADDFRVALARRRGGQMPLLDGPLALAAAMRIGMIGR